MNKCRLEVYKLNTYRLLKPNYPFNFVWTVSHLWIVKWNLESVDLNSERSCYKLGDS